MHVTRLPTRYAEMSVKVRVSAADLLTAEERTANGSRTKRDWILCCMGPEQSINGKEGT